MEIDNKHYNNLFETLYCENKSGFSMSALHTHNFYELYFLHSGSRNYIINNKVYDLEGGCFALIPPHVFHKTFGNNSHQRTLISFSKQYLNMFFQEEISEKMLSCFHSPLIHLDESELKLADTYLKELLHTSAEYGYDKRPLVLASLLTLLNSHTIQSEGHPISASCQLLSQILDYITQNFLEIETLDQLAQTFFISKFHLCRIFKKFTGLSVIQYINILKLQLACKLLTESNLSITEIGMECGFNSQIYFCKIFKNNYGISPSQYRRNPTQTISKQ